jgi:hypothetical protein
VADERGSRDAARYFGVFPMHEHVDCRCGDETCEANIRITVMADGLRVEVWAIDDQLHPGVILDREGVQQVSRVAMELLGKTATRHPGDAATSAPPDPPASEEAET